jgi:hypothetical protein
MLGPMQNARDARRRWFGLFFLAVAAAMVIWGQTVFEPYLRGVGFIAYWALCGLVTVCAIGTALLDLIVLRRRARREQRELFRKSFDLERLDQRDADAARSNEKNSQRCDGGG